MVPEEPRGRGLGPSSPLRPCAFGVLGADGPGNRGLSCDPIHKALRPGNGRLTFVQRTHRSLPISPPPPHPPRSRPGNYYVPETHQEPTTNTQNYITKYEHMLPKMLKNRPQNHRKCSQNDPRGTPGERSWNLPRGIGKKTSILTRFWRFLGSSGGSLGDPGGSHFVPGPLPRRSQGARGAIFRPFLMSPNLDPQLDPKNDRK